MARKIHIEDLCEHAQGFVRLIGKAFIATVKTDVGDYYESRSFTTWMEALRHLRDYGRLNYLDLTIEVTVDEPTKKNG